MTGAFSPLSFWSAGTRDGFTAPCIQVHIDPNVAEVGWPDDLNLGLPDFAVGLPEKLAKRRASLRQRLTEIVAPLQLSDSKAPEIPLEHLQRHGTLQLVVGTVDEHLFRPRRD
jgi:hypothetical protein